MPIEEALVTFAVNLVYMQPIFSQLQSDRRIGIIGDGDNEKYGD